MELPQDKYKARRFNKATKFNEISAVQRKHPTE